MILSQLKNNYPQLMPLCHGVHHSVHHSVDHHWWYQFFDLNIVHLTKNSSRFQGKKVFFSRFFRIFETFRIVLELYTKKQINFKVFYKKPFEINHFFSSYRLSFNERTTHRWNCELVNATRTCMAFSWTISWISDHWSKWSYADR